jgi:dTDP-glucose 4,6-dehydratase
LMTNELDKYSQRILITGGAGFIGSNLLHHMTDKYPNYLFINLDKLTYAGNLANLKSIEKNDNYRFEKGDIADQILIEDLFDRYQFTGLINLAAESHVDRSILSPESFVETNILGTFRLLEISRNHLKKHPDFRFHHISTDEVFGSLRDRGRFNEQAPYRPNSPYAASKASSDHLVRAYYKTYGLNVVTSNCSNNFGPYQFPEKLIPLIIRNGLTGIDMPVYGDGRQVRDWLFVSDHCLAIDLIFHKGRSGCTYNLGGDCEIRNIDLIRKICTLLDKFTAGTRHEKLIKHIEDRPGHDRRYAMDTSLVHDELGWSPVHGFEEGLEQTLKWYLNNAEWVENCISGDYKNYYDKWYMQRMNG